jgi:Zn-dependent M28 family amino/carboxypeptidase
LTEISTKETSNQVKLAPTSGRAWRAFFLRWILVALAAASIMVFMIEMPGKSYNGTLPPLSPQQTEIRENLRKHVSFLAGTIGQRNTIHYKPLQDASQYIEDSIRTQGYKVDSQEYVVDARKVRNLIAEIKGGAQAAEIVVVGAHYDTVLDCPGADDNTSGVAALLELARLLKDAHPARTLRFVAFVNEEPPYFQTMNMGSWVYARQAHDRHENIVAAVSLETIGMYSDAQGSQHYPVGFNLLYPSKGNFIGFVGNLSSRRLVREMVQSFRQTTAFPSEGTAAPEWIGGVGWSDHWSFWQEGYPAVMVTDSAPFRNKNYHLPSDTPDTLDYDRTARVVQGLARVVARLGQ